MTDIFDNGNAAVFDFASIAAYVNRKPQLAVAAPQAAPALSNSRIEHTAQLAQQYIDSAKASVTDRPMKDTDFDRWLAKNGRAQNIFVGRFPNLRAGTVGPGLLSAQQVYAAAHLHSKRTA